MKRPGPPPGSKKPYTGTKPAKGLTRDPHAARRKKSGAPGYPRPPEEAAARRAAEPVEAPRARSAPDTPRPPRGRNHGGPRDQAFDTVEKPRPVRGRRAAMETAAAAAPPRPPAKPPRRERPERDTLRVVADTHAPPPHPPPPKPSRAERRGERAGAEPRPMPTPEALQIFLRGARAKVGRNEIARHFGLTSEQRPELRALLERMRAAGTPTPAGKRGTPGRGAAPPAARETRPEYGQRDARPQRATHDARPERRPDTLPDMLPVEVFGTDPDGEPLARPLNWQGEGRPPLILMLPEQRGQPALAPGERVLARLRPIGPGKYEGRTFKRIAGGEAPARILGVVENGRIIPTDRRQKGQWSLEGAGAREGDIVLAEPSPAGHRHFGPKPARVTEILGRMGEAKSVSLICIHAHGIPTEFPPEAVEQAERAKATPKGRRTDLRTTPLVTIDGEDARDFDDAVFAEQDGPGGGNGWRVIVAIADVAHYVQPGSALDREARRRGNSVYFPDRVVPMLPEALSNGWCSLRPDEDRGCLFVEMRFTADGEKTGHRFGRGLMRSVARLTYEEIQAARDEGREPQALEPGHTARLYGAFEALLGARQRRGTLELDIPERRVVLSPEGQVLGVAPRPRLDSHKLIEEFMVAANVCAAEELERLVQPTMYRIHDRPSDQKMEDLRQFLQQFAINMPASNQLHPRNFSHVLEMVKGAPHERLVNETVLRSQSQAAYAPDNIGHFGLALARYAHFTSPIRRYADLMVHRALIRGLKLGADGITEAEAAEMPEIADAITATERRAAAAERDAVDRYMAAFMAARVGEAFPARISGVTRFGMFVAVDETGAQGMVPFSALPEDRWDEDPGTQSLVGRRTGLRFTLGDAVEVTLREANAMTGSLQFALRQGAHKPGGGPHRHRGKGRR